MTNDRSTDTRQRGTRRPPPCDRTRDLVGRRATRRGRHTALYPLSPHRPGAHRRHHRRARHRQEHAHQPDRALLSPAGRARTVGVIAVDPSSPFSGGALLGDRIRMSDLAGDPGVFVRSMATRGALGGLARATYDAALVLDAAGYPDHPDRNRGCRAGSGRYRPHGAHHRRRRSARHGRRHPGHQVGLDGDRRPLLRQQGRPAGRRVHRPRARTGLAAAPRHVQPGTRMADPGPQNHRPRRHRRVRAGRPDRRAQALSAGRTLASTKNSRARRQAWNPAWSRSSWNAFSPNSAPTNGKTWVTRVASRQVTPHEALKELLTRMDLTGVALADRDCASLRGQTSSILL